VYDVAETLEVFHSAKEIKESVNTTDGDMESEEVFLSCSSQNIPCKKKKSQTAEQSTPRDCMPLDETEQLQGIATQW
jgi:hypothetical protein